MVVVTHYSGLTVADMGDLRQRMRDAGATFRVTKNRLTRRALEGTKFQHLEDLFTGPTAVAYSDDPVAAAKAAVEYSKVNDKLIVLGGAMGAERLDENQVRALAALPSREALRAQMIRLLSTPARRIAVVLQEPAGQLARLLKAHSEQGQADKGEAEPGAAA